jgi:hypothetical protein
MKESHPIETAELAKARCIADEPAFAWWVPYTLGKRDIILSKINARIRKTTHKYGIEIPTSVDSAMEIDRSNNNTFWKDALAKDMTQEIHVTLSPMARGRNYAVLNCVGGSVVVLSDPCRVATLSVIGSCF